MTQKRTRLLRDEPAPTDELGPHSSISTLILDEIITSDHAHSIAVIGDWGSGKSTIIKLLSESFKALPESVDVHARAFIYDAWAHQGDPLRRSFLDDLITFFRSNNLLTRTEADENIDAIWNRAETTKTTSEPILYRHAKWLMFSALVALIGPKIVDVPSSILPQSITQIVDALTTKRNLIGVGITFLPLWLALIFSGVLKCGSNRVKEWFFGESYKSPNFGITSFIVEKIQGKVERKTTRTPNDSIIEFKKIFYGLLTASLNHDPKLRLVIIIDNIDRLPAEQARQFWSTMQTFFDASGGSSKISGGQYWLVAPFSERALSNIFKENAGGASGSEIAKAFVDKVFETTLYVPPPILSNWRKYLFDKLRYSFPEHEERDLRDVCDLYDFGKANPIVTITPRDLKLYVNALVLLFRLRGEEVSLQSMASYIIHQSNITGTGINIFNEDFLTKEEIGIIDDPEWYSLFAALYFGVSREEGLQLLLAEPILNALRQAKLEELKNEESKSGFYEVLPKVIRQEAARWEPKDGIKVIQTAALISSLVGVDSIALLSVWTELGRKLRVVDSWDNFQASLVGGLTAIISRIPPTQQEAVINDVLKSLASATTPEPDAGNPVANPSAENWLAAVLALLRLAGETVSIPTNVPGSPLFKLETIQVLAGSDASENLKKSIIFESAASQIGLTLGAVITNGRYLRDPRKFVALIAARKTAIAWPPIVQSTAIRLQQPNISAAECLSLVSLLVALDGSVPNAGANSAIQQLSANGHLAILMNAHAANPRTKAMLCIATLIANPLASEPQWNQVISSSPIDAKLLNELHNLTNEFLIGGKLFSIGVKTSNVWKLVSAITGELIKSGYSFATTPQEFLNSKNNLIENGVFDPAKFIHHMMKKDELLALLVSDGFQVERSKYYFWALDFATSTHKVDFIHFLEEGIRGLPKTDWDLVVNSSSIPHTELLELCSVLTLQGPPVDLEINTRDPLLSYTRKLISGEIAHSPAINERVRKTFNLLGKSFQKTLLNDLVEDLMSLQDVGKIKIAKNLFSEAVSPDVIKSFDRARIVARLFNPLLGQPEATTLKLILDVAQSEPKFLESLDEATCDDFIARLRAASLDATIADPEKKIIAEIVETWNVDLTQKVEATPEPPSDDMNAQAEDGVKT